MALEITLREVGIEVRVAQVPQQDGSTQEIRILRLIDQQSGIVVQVPFHGDSWDATNSAMNAASGGIETATPADLQKLEAVERAAQQRAARRTARS